jgi:hypothetical protein
MRDEAHKESRARLRALQSFQKQWNRNSSSPCASSSQSCDLAMVQNLCPTSRGAAAIGLSDRKTRKILQSYFFVISKLRSKKILGNSA